MFWLRHLQYSMRRTRRGSHHHLSWGTEFFSRVVARARMNYIGRPRDARPLLQAVDAGRTLLVSPGRRQRCKRVGTRSPRQRGANEHQVCPLRDPLAYRLHIAWARGLRRHRV